MVQQCDVILSVVPPRDAAATAQRVIDALSGGTTKRESEIYFVDLNAVSPTSVRAIAASFEKSRVPVRFVDGCILGFPPRLLEKTETSSSSSEKSESKPGDGWFCPNFPVSGPHRLSSVTPGGDLLTSVLRLDHIADEIGKASGLKMCFAAMAKGFTALATQSFTTAHRLGVADALRAQLADAAPATLSKAEASVPNMVPKAYRWVREMEEIAATFSDDGGWERDLFRGAAGTYQAVADDPVLGKERVGKRQRGTDLESVAGLLADGLDKKKKKTE